MACCECGGSDSDQIDPLLLFGKRTVKVEEKKPCFPQRYLMAILVSLAGVHAGAMRVNFNIVMVNLLNTTVETNNTADECPIHAASNTSIQQTTGYLNYDHATLFGAFYYGYTFFAQIIGGILSERFGIKRVLATSIFFSALGTFLTPVAINSFYSLVAIRVVMGVFQGPLYPSIYVFIARWTPDRERTFMTAIATTGTVLGYVIMPALTGYLCTTEFLGGWPSAFYVAGLSSCVWVIVWLVYAADSPTKHRFISHYERSYLEHETENLGSVSYKFPPLRKMLTSVPLWALGVVVLTDSFGYNVIYTGVPIYLKQILHLDIEQDGIISAVIFLVNWISAILMSPLIDFVQTRGFCSLQVHRKVLTLVGEVSMGGLLVAVGYAGCNHVLGITLIIVAFSLSATTVGGFTLSTQDIAPMYSGTLFGIVNGLANACGFITPVVIFAVTEGLPSLSRWRTMFLLTGGIMTGGAVVFTLFGTAQELDWARERRLKDTKNDSLTADIQTQLLPS